MTQEEMELRCEEAIALMGDKTMVVVVGILAGLEYDMKEWYHNGQNNLDEMELSIGKSYAGLKLLEKYIHADPSRVQKGIEEVLRRN